MSAAARDLAVAAVREADAPLYIDAATRSLASHDFGGVATGRCLVAAEPRDAESAARLLRGIDGRGLGCTLRGTGYGQGGQSVALDTVSLSTRRLDWIGAVDPVAKTIAAGAGATLRRVLQALDGSGFVPPALPLNLDMSLGGLLSAGGVGPSSHCRGPVISNVPEVTVATTAGRIETCSRTQNADLFEAVLGGIGQCGLITDATLALRPAPRRMRVLTLQYTELSHFIGDQVIASEANADVEIEGYCWASARSLGSTALGPRPLTHWTYGLHFAFDVERGAAAKNLASSLRADRQLDEYETDLMPYLHRYEPRFVGMVEAGAWNAPHPWFEGLVPVGRLEEFLNRILPDLPPEFGDGHRIMLLDPSRAPSLFRQNGGQLAVVGIFPVAFAPNATAKVLAALDRFTALVLELGGRRYLSGWLGSDPSSYFRAHFGTRYDAWRETRRRYDPRGTFRSALFPRGHLD